MHLRQSPGRSETGEERERERMKKRASARMTVQFVRLQNNIENFVQQTYRDLLADGPTYISEYVSTARLEIEPPTDFAYVDNHYFFFRGSRFLFFFAH